MSTSIKDRLKILEKQNRLLKENLIDSIWVVDAKTLRYEFSAPPVGKHGVYTDEDLIGKSIFDELTPASSKRAIELLRKEVKRYERGEHTAQSLELELVKKGGGTFWVEIRAKLVDESGSPLKIVGITKDITARKKAEQQLEGMNKKLIEALADKERLLKEIKVLRGLLPICSACKRIRDDSNKWWPLEAYVRKHTDSDFTHTICPDCKDVIYPGLK